MTAFTIHLDERTSEALQIAAAERSTSVESLIAGAAENLLNEVAGPGDVWSVEDVAAIEQGIAQLDRGEGVPQEVVIAAMRAKYG